MNVRRMIVIGAVIVSLILIAGGCKKSEPETTPPTSDMKMDMSKAADQATAAVKTAAGSLEQTICPVMGNPINKDVYVEYKGKKVYFCCPDCKAKFNADPEKYVAKLPQFKE